MGPINGVRQRYVGTFLLGHGVFGKGFVIMETLSSEAAREMMVEQFGTKWDTVYSWKEWMDLPVYLIMGKHRVYHLPGDDWQHGEPITTLGDLVKAMS